MPSPLLQTLGFGYILIAIVCGGAALPLLYRKVPRNCFYGFRLRAALRSPEAWYAINEFAAGRMLRYCGVLFAMGVAALVFSYVFVDSQLGTGFPWQAIVGILPLVYCINRPGWEAYRWAQRHYNA